MPYDIQLQQIHEVIQRQTKNVSYVLTDRLWPRGISKADLGTIIWYKDAGPAPALRKGLHDGSLSAEMFEQAYKKQLLETPETLEPLLKQARQGDLCLLTATHNPNTSYLVVLLDALLKKLEAKASK
ncbi:DUF488 family protein [Paenalcaligenes niemegkensis]|uniref:DUF488 domain-containing protein n=1 Tax=Paenalcaligenes niemegkensis TaxID=2895469 RepID=UPI001EE88674|nr:DUF488 family protein [Paenalcaligenes niemegkensis]MCQ9617677.1 DUF488 family protein [Paenalcaligenes niemegkensis]